ncbi:MAG: DNA polymerase III subunit chi [Holosporaceae bacterium]|nr:DNA polymerase III subunit chi [Holosporaceae bacterium]
MYSNLAEFVLYEVEVGGLQSVALGLLEKIYASGTRCVFYSPLDERIKVIDKALWTFSTNAFVPHGDRSVGFCEQQPIYMTNIVENPNGAKILMMMDSYDYRIWDADRQFERIILLWEQNDNAAGAINDLRQDLQKKLKNVVYWRQLQKKWTKIA